MTSSSVEKLVFEIFSRKTRLIEQSKHQSDLYIQHLASNLAIDGISPPSWLFSPNRTTSPKEISKDELVLKLVCCSRPHDTLYSDLQVVSHNVAVEFETLTSDKCLRTGSDDNVHVFDGVCVETFTSDTQNCPSVVPVSGEGCSLKDVSEIDFRTTVPVDQTEQGVLSVPEVVQSFQRSKSRQKALELRSGSKSLTKIGLSHGELNENFKFPSLATEQEGRRDEVLQLAQGRGAEEDGEKLDFGESVCQSIENDLVVSTSSKVKVGTRQSVSDFNVNQAVYVNALQQSPSSRILKSLDVQDCQGRDIEINVCSENVSVSEFSCREAGDYSNTSRSSENAQMNIFNEQQCADSAVDKELVLCNPTDTNQRGELEYLVEGSSLNSSLFAEPMALDVCDFTLTSSTYSSEIKRLNNMSERTDCSVLDPAKSIDKRASGVMNQLSVDEESTDQLSVCSKEGEERAETFDSSDISQDNAMTGLNCERAEVNDTPHRDSHPVKLRVDQDNDSLLRQYCEEENWRAKSMDKVSLISNALVSNACKQSNSLDLTIVESHGGLNEECEMSGLKRPYLDGFPVFDSWPRLKRRKIKHHESNRHTSSPCIGMKKLHNIQISPSSTHMTNIEKDVESIGMGIMELVGFDFESQNGEDRFYSKEQRKSKSSLTPSELSETTVVAGLTRKKAGNSVGNYVEGMETHSHILDDKHCNRHSSFFNENIAENTYHEKISGMDQYAISSEHYDGAELQGSVLSPRNNSECNVVGQSLSVLDEFMVDAQSNNGELDFSADEIDFEKLKSPRNMLERASILAKICISASTDTPLSDLSSALERASLLASLDMDTIPLNCDVDKQHGFGNSLVNNVKDALERMPHSGCLPNYDARYGWNPRNLSASPVGMFWDSLSLQSGSSSGKCTSTNPDLKCFRIEEDSCGSEENDTMDVGADNVQNDIDSSPTNPCDSRQPLKEITNLVLPPASTEPVSISLTTKPIIGATQFKVKRSLRKQTPSVGNSEVSEKQMFSVGAKGIKKDRESIIRSVNRPVLRSKSRLKREEQKLSIKDSRKNNIVSNVNSFLPLVQQKQAAPICAGKREVKVKALEAAKRLEERRQNERRIKKDALRSDRAKLEEKNMREMDIKKKKEAERKKKEDDAITKKRLREEEEKKKKRAGAIQRQREQQDEKLRMHAKKTDKQKDHPKGGRKNNKPQVAESKNQHTNGVMRVNDSVLKDTETGRASVELAMHTADKSPTRGILMAQTNQGKSYEISPYQCSDDEDDDEEELPVKKSIPSWASKSSVTLLLALQQEMEPDAIFPPDSFCPMDDVLLSHKVK